MVSTTAPAHSWVRPANREEEYRMRHQRSIAATVVVALGLAVPKKLRITIAAAALVAVAPIAASGAAFHSAEKFTDPDFCGTGASVDVLFENTLAHLSERHGVGKAEHHGRVTFTYGDASVILSFAG